MLDEQAAFGVVLAMHRHTQSSEAYAVKHTQWSVKGAEELWVLVREPGLQGDAERERGPGPARGREGGKWQRGSNVAGHECAACEELDGGSPRKALTTQEAVHNRYLAPRQLLVARAGAWGKVHRPAAEAAR